ncbi:YdiU family protein [Leptotrichia sp. OH3620_COT-345]|uniref:protein adenylyltransferase SelO n=1 Tax=Leptotrichia sp. OH3620_COT-345 TaxID=2491048 RepID=UPI000F649EA2|nr:YdiU family protein [Leptotrichia sp. OH3620_COT-345]RRD39910.1 YdiU family protein [Leptotrichia sp. OH3620_COT-345]
MTINLKNTYYKELPDKFYTQVNPIPFKNPKMILFNDNLAENLGFDENERAFFKSSSGVEFFSGNKLPVGSIPIAQAYAGHQFGHFTMLGDGRALLLGEFTSEDGTLYDIQLKGSGKTPYSRNGDGKAVLAPMLREYIISEAMFYLNIPTTRSLAVVTTGETVYRGIEKIGAVLTRTAKGHIRTGTFEYAYKYCNLKDLKILTDYTINRFFPHLEKIEGNIKYILFIEEVIKLQAKLISQWDLTGFVHGVMNTDNMSVCGETIDYGPCAFMDIYHPATVFSSIDIYGRYSYENQSRIGLWNLTVFAECILPIFNYTYNSHQNSLNYEKAIILVKEKLSEFNILYNKYKLSSMRKKLGLFNENENDEKLYKDLLNIMEKYKADYTNTFVGLTTENFGEKIKYNFLFFNSQDFKNWKHQWELRKKQQENSKKESINLMKKHNPIVIPRNHIVEEALFDAENGNFETIKSLLDILSTPYNYNRKLSEKYTEPLISRIPYQTYCGT